MYKYGPQINKNSFSDYFIKAKNRVLSKYQSAFLKRFGKLAHPSAASGMFASMSRRIIGSFIYSIKIELNNFCNLKCEMCYVPNEKNKSLSAEKVFELLDQAGSNGVRIELLGGEPLMRPDIIEIVRYAKKKAGVPFLTIYTNGTCVTERKAMELKKAGVDAVLVTLVSHDKEIHDNFTGVKGSYDKTIAGIKRLAKAGIETYTFTSIHKANFRDFRSVYTFVKNELGVHSLFYQYVPQKKDDPLMISNLDWNKIKYAILTEINPKHMLFVRDFYMLTGNACSGGNFVFTVKVDGSVQPCPFISNLPMGNVFQDSIWTIYKRRFKAPGLKEFKSTPTGCKKCVYSSICGGGCKAGNDLLFGSYECMDHRCLGPYSEHKEKDEIMRDIPTFF